MAAHYDTYDYPAYWEGREYEHKAEEIAIKGLLNLVPEIGTILEIGAGHGRLIPTYSFRAKKIIVSDPSSKLLKIAKDTTKDNKTKFIHSGLDGLNKKIRTRSIDLVLLVRVLHHMEDPKESFKKIHKLIKNDGYFILEFANKCHFKAVTSNFIKGNFTFLADIFPKDARSKKTKKKKSIPFKNYHPDYMFNNLEDAGFEIIEIRSVSNIRSNWTKKYLSTDMRLSLEKHTQKPLAKINFGPSIFLLAKKKG